VLVLGRRVGEGIMIGHDIKVTVLSAGDDKIRIGIDAPADVKVHRYEVYVEIQEGSAATESTENIVAEPTATASEREGKVSDRVE